MRGFTFDPDSRVWTHPSHRHFDYSDGADLEKRMLEILRQTEDISCLSKSLARQISDWPTMYHFSPRRHNLLRHLKFPSDSTILELGAGCGAITRQLGETGAEVCAVEGSPTRAACAAARVRTLENVRVVSCHFEQLPTGEQFDIVTLIGVLEYAPVFFKSEAPLLACLRLARSLLKPGGTLIIAIENQLGLKYFCSAPEDHTGRPFDGIQSRYEKNSPKTCGRSELIQLLAEAEFPDPRFQYPFPDYKLPRWVLTQKAFETQSFDPCAILRTINPVHDGAITAFPADERRIWPALHRNGLVPDLSNSFLIQAGKDLSDDGLLAAGCALERRNCFNTQTKILADSLGRIAVHKTRLTPETPPAGIDIVFSPCDEPYQPGPQLETQIAAAIQSRDWEGMISGLSRWLDFVVENGLIEKKSDDLYASALKPEFFDCQPRNLIVVGDSLVPIDHEWRYTDHLPLRNHVLRYLSLLARQEEEALRRHMPEKTPLAWQLAHRMGIPISKAQLGEYRRWQHTLNAWIVGEKPPKKTGLLKKLWPSKS
ncbi:MAG: class I SAM-dependent methyltransferase [Tepidisphaeraceae bacterium]|jgi:SAM-dependent methyltransferase